MTIEELNKLLENAAGSEALQNLLKNITAELKSVENSLGSMSSAAGSSAAQVQELTEKKRQLAAMAVTVKQKILEASDAFAALGAKSLDATKESSDAVKDLAAKVMSMGNSLKASLGPVITQNIGLFAVHKSAWMRDLVNPGQDFKRISQGLFKGINEGLRNLLNVQNIARTGFMALGAGVEEANRKAEAFPQLMRQSALSMNLTKEELKRYNETIRFVPGALDTASDSLLKMMGLQSQQIQVSALAQVAIKAWGMTGEEGARMQEKAYLQLGRSGEAYLHMLGEMHGAVKSGVIPQQEAVRQIMSANDSLAVFGNKAGLATNVWKTFAEALTAGGVTAKQVGSIVEQVTQGIANMSLENRAFIGMMSGMFQGATALGGGLRMELAMRGPGGLEQGLEALTSSLARFGGGQIITLQQAANNPQLEMQFVLQRQMLGQLSGIRNAEQQNRVLEVLQGVQQGGISRLQGSKELGDLMKRGGNVQQSTLTAIERVERVLADNIYGAINQMAGNLEQNLSVLQRVGGLQPGQTNVARTAIGRMATAPAIFGRGREAAAAQEAGAGAQQFRQQIGDFFTTRMVGGRNLRERAMQTIGGNTVPPSVISAVVRGVTGALSQHLRNMPAAITVPRTPTMALTPGAQPQMPARAPTMGLTGLGGEVGGAVGQPQQTVNQQLLQAITTLNTRMNITPSRQRPSPAVVENVRTTVRGTTTGAGAPAPTPAPTITSTEQTITIKVDSDKPELKRLIMTLLKREIPRFINGENISGVD